jgi:hypothetical protein
MQIDLQRSGATKEEKRKHRPTKYSAKCDTPSTYIYTVYDYKSISHGSD